MSVASLNKHHFVNWTEWVRAPHMASVIDNLMKIEKANIEYQNSELLKEVIKWYNHSHRNSSRSSKLKSTSNSKHELTVIDKSDLIPYGIYDIGIQIGFMEMKQKFRIKICKCLGDYKEEIYKSNVYPNNEKFHYNK